MQTWKDYLMLLKLQNNCNSNTPTITTTTNQTWLVTTLCKIYKINLILRLLNNYRNLSSYHIKRVPSGKHNLNMIVTLTAISSSDRKLLNFNSARMIRWEVLCKTSSSNHKWFSYPPKHLQFSLAHPIRFRCRASYHIQHCSIQLKQNHLRNRWYLSEDLFTIN